MSRVSELTDHEPHPGALARLLIEHGDATGALLVCEVWRRREPDLSEIAEVEAAARAISGQTTGPLPFDASLAEMYVQKGFLEEALIVYRRARADRDRAAAVRARIDLIDEFLQYRASDAADPRQIMAEGHVRSRRLPSALIEYRELARRNPTDQDVIRRADQLRAIVLGVPRAVVPPGDPDELGATMEMPLATRAALLLREANFGVAAQLYQVLSRARPADTGLAEVAEAIQRIGTLAAGEKAEEEAEQQGHAGTLRLSTESIALFHVRMGNLAEAVELYRGLVERRPQNERYRRVLEDVRALVHHLSSVHEAQPQGAAEDPPKPDKEHRQTQPIGQKNRGPSAPNPQRYLGKKKRSGVLALQGFRAPESPETKRGQGLCDAEQDPTERVAAHDLAEIQFERGFYDRALILFEHLSSKHPDNEHFRDRVATIRERLGTGPSSSSEEIRAAHADQLALNADTLADSRPPLTEAALRSYLKAESPVLPAGPTDERMSTVRAKAVNLPVPNQADGAPKVPDPTDEVEVSIEVAAEEPEPSSAVAVPFAVPEIIERPRPRSRGPVAPQDGHDTVTTCPIIVVSEGEDEA